MVCFVIVYVPVIKNVYVLGFFSSYLGYSLRRDSRHGLRGMKGKDKLKVPKDFEPQLVSGYKSVLPSVLLSLKASEISPKPLWGTCRGDDEAVAAVCSPLLHGSWFLIPHRQHSPFHCTGRKGLDDLLSHKHSLGQTTFQQASGSQ